MELDERYPVTAERCRGLQGGRGAAWATSQRFGSRTDEQCYEQGAQPGASMARQAAVYLGHVRTVRAHLLAALGRGIQAVGRLTILKALRWVLPYKLHTPLAPALPCPGVCPQVRVVTAACS